MYCMGDDVHFCDGDTRETSHGNMLAVAPKLAKTSSHYKTKFSNCGSSRTYFRVGPIHREAAHYIQSCLHNWALGDS